MLVYFLSFINLRVFYPLKYIGEPLDALLYLTIYLTEPLPSPSVKSETLSNFLNHRIGDSLRRLLKDNFRKTCRFVCLIVCWLGLPSKYTTHLSNGVVLPWRGEVSNITNNSFLKSSVKNKRFPSTILKPWPDF